MEKKKKEKLVKFKLHGDNEEKTEQPMVEIFDTVLFAIGLFILQENVRIKTKQKHK